jgi:hypothetical protein
VWYTEDRELNFDGLPIDAQSEDEALIHFQEIITELMNCNCLDVENDGQSISVFEPSDHDFIERYEEFKVGRIYTLLDKDGKQCFSRTPGTFGGHRKLKIYGKLDCPSALRYIAKGQYVKHRVFFKDENTAIAAGYRPCAKCMKKEYDLWKETHQF